MPTERADHARGLVRTASAVAVLVTLIAPSLLQAQSDAATADQRPHHGPFAATLGIEASVVGFSMGPRGEFLWRLGNPEAVSHLRVHAGALDGPEFLFVPIGVGYRASFLPQKRVQPFVGVGYEAHWFITDGVVFSQLATLNIEAGCAFAIDGPFAAGLGTSLDWTFAGERGPGLQLRLFGGYRF